MLISLLSLGKKTSDLRPENTVGSMTDKREKMISSILPLISLTCCVSGSFVVNVTQTSYQAEENHNITLEWTFTTRTNSSPNSLYIYCELLADLEPLVLFHLHEGVEVPESQDEQFAGRVRCDKDVLREGRLRLHVSRLRTNDSGLYRCDVLTGHGGKSRICRLNVTGELTAAPDEPRPQRPTVSPQPESRGRISLYVGLGLGLTAAALCAGLCFAFRHYLLNLLIRNETSVQSYRVPQRNNPSGLTGVSLEDPL